MIEGGPLETTIEKFKTVVFSHGLGGTRFFYTGICCELASQGYVVIALEHRDESPSMTYYFKSEEKLKRQEPTWIRFKRVKVGTSSHLPARKAQVEKRASECRRALTLLEDLNAGKDIGNILNSSIDLGQFRVRKNLQCPLHFTASRPRYNITSFDMFVVESVGLVETDHDGTLVWWCDLIAHLRNGLQVQVRATVNSDLHTHTALHILPLPPPHYHIRRIPFAFIMTNMRQLYYDCY